MLKGWTACTLHQWFKTDLSKWIDICRVFPTIFFLNHSLSSARVKIWHSKREKMFRVENLKNISSSYTFWPKKKTFRFTLSLLRLFSKWGKVKQDIAFSLKTKHLKLFFSQRLNNYQIIIKLKSQCLKDVRTTLLISDLVNPALNDASLSLKNRTDQPTQDFFLYPYCGDILLQLTYDFIFLPAGNLL